MSIVQEKFQVQYPDAENEQGNTWKSDKSVRVKKGAPDKGASLFTLTLPPGSDMEDQEYTDQRVMRTVTAGTDDITDNPSGADFKKGCVYLEMRPTDDMYTNEHQDLFYSSVTVDGETGFVERANTLDRM